MNIKDNFSKKKKTSQFKTLPPVLCPLGRYYFIVTGTHFGIHYVNGETDNLLRIFRLQSVF